MLYYPVSSWRVSGIQSPFIVTHIESCLQWRRHAHTQDKLRNQEETIGRHFSRPCLWPLTSSCKTRVCVWEIHSGNCSTMCLCCVFIGACDSDRAPVIEGGGVLRDGVSRVTEGTLWWWPVGHSNEYEHNLVQRNNGDALCPVLVRGEIKWDNTIYCPTVGTVYNVTAVSTSGINNMYTCEKI